MSVQNRSAPARSASALHIDHLIIRRGPADRRVHAHPAIIA